MNISCMHGCIKSTLPKTNSSPLKMVASNNHLLFQWSIFRGKLLVSGRVYDRMSWVQTIFCLHFVVPPPLCQDERFWSERTPLRVRSSHDDVATAPRRLEPPETRVHCYGNLGAPIKNFKHLAILLVPFFGMVKRDPLKGCWSPPNREKIKVTLNHPGMELYMELCKMICFSFNKGFQVPAIFGGV